MSRTEVADCRVGDCGSIKFRKKATLMTTREHPCRSGRFGMFLGRVQVARLPPVCRAAWPAENAICDVGRLGLIPALPLCRNYDRMRA